MGKGDPDFLGLGGYNSGAEASTSSGSGSSSDADSDDRSVDSAELRAAEAAARLKDYGATSSKPNTALPSALDAFTEVAGRPAFLDPEATRPLATSRTHGLAGGAGGAAAPGQQGKGKKGRLPAEGEFDISRLAPPVKGQQQQSDKRGPPGAVIEGKAKRYKQEDGPEATQQYTAAQIAMMGGNVEQMLDGSSDPVGGGDKAARGPATKPMGVSEFLDKGVGGAQLPRKQQDRKEKEKLKREAGQSTHKEWKSEAEMVLRQQYD